jgi:hypothetical protein
MSSAQISRTLATPAPAATTVAHIEHAITRVIVCVEELEAPVGPLPAPSRMVSPTRLSAGACSTNEALLPLR